MSDSTSVGARDMWTCPCCGRTFANRNQAHACAPLGEVNRHFEGTDQAVRESFDRIVGSLGPVSVLPERTRIALSVRMSFAAFQPRRHWLDGHLVLARGASHPLIRRVQVFSRRNLVHAFRIHAPDDIDAAFLDLCREAYGVGEQRHHAKAPE